MATTTTTTSSLPYVIIVLALTLARFTTTCFSSKVYVVYLGSKRSDALDDDTVSEDHGILSAVHGGSLEEAQAAHLYSYRHGFRGFAARLSEDQASEISKMPGVVSVFPNAKRSLHTTHSWEFLGLAGDETAEIVGYSTRSQVNVVVGFIDTGIWPEAPSFNDDGMPPVPAKWKGICQEGESFNLSSCNRKVIGARYYLSGYEAEEGTMSSKVSFKSPRDSSGHGSHTASTAVGRYVENMNYKGLAAGGARGGAPMARIAVYKTCWDSGCYDADLLSAFDDAIKDGVNILSLSLGPDAPQGDYFNDAISIGSYHAATQGILVVSSAGNEGRPSSVTNLAPWMITVAASSTDREIKSDVMLANGANFSGASLTVLEMKLFTSIVSASDVFAGYFTPYQSSFCLESSLNRSKARGKVLVCQHSGSSSESKLEKSVVVKDAGGVGMILIDDADKDVAVPFVIPSAIVGRATGNKILAYLNHTRKPMSRILPAKTIWGSQPAPRIAAFSSKGPNYITPEILKPDVAAPGLNILAAWSPAVSQMQFNILSGTSMSCPHVTGIAALIKSVHPTWSPSAIKSAIMTTASMLDRERKFITIDPNGRRGNAFDFGSGFVNPTRALNPGLIYEAAPEDYRAFLCAIGYDEKSLHLITRDNITCAKTLPTASELNYTSITVPYLKERFSVTRTATNVGKPRITYEAMISHPRGIEVTVIPKRLMFTGYGEKINFTVNFKVVSPSKGYSFGFLAWRSGKVLVTSPLVVRLASSVLERVS